MAEETTKKKAKIATPIKRHKQDVKKQARNKNFKSRVHTARVAFSKATGEEKEGMLKELHSLIDKAQKRGLFKANKSARLKSRVAAKVS